ncbi:MAG: hypothetical protein JWQ71_572 [Pedosphaera sp.]|nr:hypothetical protein [Pedosphaera sp.]
MVLSSDELEILHYLKGYKGTFVPAVEICRRAGGRRRYESAPNWAGALMSRLVDAKFVEVNERGHYRFVRDTQPVLLDDNYFPTEESAPLENEDYIAVQDESGEKTNLWISPHIAEILRKAGKSVSGPGKVSRLE